MAWRSTSDDSANAGKFDFHTGLLERATSIAAGAGAEGRRGSSFERVSAPARRVHTPRQLTSGHRSRGRTSTRGSLKAACASRLVPGRLGPRGPARALARKPNRLYALGGSGARPCAAGARILVAAKNAAMRTARRGAKSRRARAELAYDTGRACSHAPMTRPYAVSARAARRRRRKCVWAKLSAPIRRASRGARRLSSTRPRA